MRKGSTKDNNFRKTTSYHLPLISYLLFKKGQTAMELAVFGAILIFVVGAIVRQALSAGSMQNEYLRAMRQAMSTSYRYSAGLLGGGGADGDSSHQTAQILFVEDRLTADSAKYGAIERTPYVVSAAATYSRNLFRPVTAIVEQNLPIYDVFINGRHFPFTTAAFKTVELAKNCAGATSCPAECSTCAATNADGASNLQLYPGPDLPCAKKSPCPSQCGGDCSSLPASSWEPNCAVVVRALSQCISGDCIAACPDSVNNCTVSPGPPVTDTQIVGCAKLYDVIYNHPSYLEWCDSDASCPVSLCKDICNPDFCNAGAGDCDAASTVTFPANLTADERFDLDRDGATDVPGALGTAREDFFWQWYLVMGVDGKIVTTNALQRGAGIVQEPSDCKKDCADSQHTVIDVDGDLKRERLMIDSKQVDDETGVIKKFVVMDVQDGDLDFSRGDSDTGPEPGLQKNAKMFARVQDGTYLQIEEGKLYATVKNPICVAGCAGDAACIAACPGDPNQYIRTTSKKDQIDLVERTIQLSNDTDRFCDSSGSVNNDSAIWPAGLPNPVEACNDCNGANIQKTCMDEANKLIYVRSRVVDRRGRKWITNTSSDDYVDFAKPPAP